MILLEHSTYGDKTIVQSLGLPEYSYWFVRKAFTPLLERFGPLISVSAPGEEVDRIYRSADAHGQPCVFLSFSPPHQVPPGLACPTVPVFAWEFDTIPDEAWNEEPANDWRAVLARTPAAVTHSEFSVRAVRRALGADYPVWSIPAPVADRQAGLDGGAKGWRDRAEIEVSDALVFDTREIDLDLFAYGADARSARAMRMLQSAARRDGGVRRRLTLEGVVYTSVLNPVDGRKNWADMTAAFIYAFRDEPLATLILKTTYRDVHEAVTPILQDFAKLGRFRCRILIIHGMLDEGEYRGLLEATAYAVNTSHGEGQCLPLMEYMAAGRPAVTPRHTAMLEYVSAENAFVVADHHRPAYWPHDMRQASRCLRHQVEFADLVRRYRGSFVVARDDPKRYAAMSRAAVAALKAFCGDAVVSGRLGEVFAHVAPGSDDRRVAAAAAPPKPPVVETAADPLAPKIQHIGLSDAMHSGWFNEGAGELAPGFPVSADDVVVDVGCGDGGAAAFCARLGAHVILADVDAERLAATEARLRREGARAVEAHHSDAQPLPLADASVSRVVCMEVMEHVADPSAFMAELARVGAPGALYLLTVPAALAEQLQKTLAPPLYFEPPNHVRIFEPDAFEAVVRGAGLVIERRSSYGFYNALWWLLFWQCNTPLQDAARHPLLSSWATTWAMTLDGRDGPAIQEKLNGVLPKNQVIVARKP